MTKLHTMQDHSKTAPGLAVTYNIMRAMTGPEMSFASEATERKVPL